MQKRSWQSYGMDCLLGNSSLDFLESTQLPLLLEISGWYFSGLLSLVFLKIALLILKVLKVLFSKLESHSLSKAGDRLLKRVWFLFSVLSSMLVFSAFGHQILAQQIKHWFWFCPNSMSFLIMFDFFVVVKSKQKLHNSTLPSLSFPDWKFVFSCVHSQH